MSILLPAATGFLSVSMLIIISVMMYDWWSFGNAVTMGLSVLVRWFLDRENIEPLDHVVSNACIRTNGKSGDEGKVKLLITTS